MLIGERHQKLIDLINKNGSMTVDELSHLFKVSKITIRSDLKVLEGKSQLVRTHGGAMSLTDDINDLPLIVKETRYREEKFLIGREAVKHINDGETIVLDSGSTTIEIAKQIAKRSFSFLTIITNGLNIALELSRVPNLQIIMVSGTMRKPLYSFVGPLAEEVMNQFHADCLFLAVDGIDVIHGLSTPDIMEARHKKKMIEVAKKVILVTDSSKFGKRNLSYIAPSKVLDTVITDSNAPVDDTNYLKELGVEVIIV